MNKNAHHKKEGIDLGSSMIFGDPAEYFSEFTFFMILEDIDWGAQFYFYYRITDDHYIQIAYGLDDKRHTICAQYQKTNQDIKINLKEMLIKYLKAGRFYGGYLYFVESTLFTACEFTRIIEAVKNELEVLKDEAGNLKTPFIDYLEKTNFNPKPTGNTKHSWIIGCPNAEGKHFLMISALNDEWGCGYCKKKGNLEEFKNWMNEINKKN